MQDKSDPDHFDVVIVGRGPVGATLANLLGLCGVRTLMLEREARTYHLPRAVHFDDECMRVFQTIGLADAILPHVILSPGMLFLDADGAEIAEKMVGISNIEFYAFYLTKSLELARAALKKMP